MKSKSKRENMNSLFFSFYNKTMQIYCSTFNDYNRNYHTSNEQ